MAKTIWIPEEYERLLDTEWREAAVEGGRFSLKSHTIARILLIRARMKQARILCGREFQNSIADSSHQLLSDLIALYGLSDFEITDKTIINKINGSDFLFKGLRHNEQSIKSIEGIDIAWVEEAQTISKGSLEILTPTVRKPGSQIIYSYNRLLENDPVHVRCVIEGRPNTIHIHTDYRIAVKYKMMPESILAEVNSDMANRPTLYKHKWLGEPSSLERKVYHNWQTIDSVPHEAKIVRRGMDFGYTNDPTVIISVYQYNGGYIIDEELYRKGMLNDQLAAFLNNLPDANTLVVADSSEPKSIDEIRRYGVNIIGVNKVGGTDSLGNKKSFKRYAIDYVQQQKISVTKRSENTWKEYCSYLFMEDREGRILNDPEDGNDHAMDATLYGFHSLRPAPLEDEDISLYNVDYT